MSGPPNHNLPAAGDRVYAGYSYNTTSHWHPYHNPLDLNPLATDLGYEPVTNRYHPYSYQSEELPPIYGQHHSNTQPTLHHQSPATQPDTSLIYSEMDEDLPGTLSEDEDLIQSLPLP
jgi:hypothetical protein